MKRHRSLILFSHEHHHGLVFCSRLKKTRHIENSIIQDFVRDFWDKYLKKHFEQEEDEFLSLIADKEIADKFLGDHVAIRELFMKIGSPSGNKYEQAMELSNILNDHIRFEERILFPFLEKTAADKFRGRIPEHAEEVKAHRYSPEFWRNNIA